MEKNDPERQYERTKEEMLRLVDENWGKFSGYASAILYDHQLGEDVVQSLALNIMKGSSKTYIVDLSKTAWLYACIRNLCFESQRKRGSPRLFTNLLEKKERNSYDNDPEETYTLYTGFIYNHLPDEDCIRAEDIKAVQSGLSKLSDGRREILWMYHFQDLSYQEISKRLGIPVNRLKNRMFKARKNLVKILMIEGERINQNNVA